MHTNLKALTLIEILIVTVILGIITAIAVPRFVITRNEAEQAACDDAAAIIANAIQMWALATDQASTTAVDPEDPGQGWGVYIQDGVTPQCPTWVRDGVPARNWVDGEWTVEDFEVECTVH